MNVVHRKSNVDGFVKRLKTSFGVIPAKSLPQRREGRESSVFKYFWMPAFAGMTEFRTFYEFVNIEHRIMMSLRSAI